LQQQTGQLPHPESVPPEVIDQQEEVRRVVAQALVKVGDEEKEQQQRNAMTTFVKRYHELMQQRDVVNAWHYLQEMPASSPELSQMQEKFKAQIVSSLREKYLAILTNTPGDWPKAREVIDEVRNAPALWITLTDEQQQALNKLRSEIDAREDQALYDDVV